MQTELGLSNLHLGEALVQSGHFSPLQFSDSCRSHSTRTEQCLHVWYASFMTEIIHLNSDAHLLSSKCHLLKLKSHTRQKHDELLDS